MRAQIFVFGSLLLATTAVSCCATESVFAATTATLVNPTAAVEYGHTDGPATMLLRVDGVDPQSTGALGHVAELVEVPGQNPRSTKVTFKVAELYSPGTTSRNFLVTADVTGLPVNSSVPRYLMFALDGTATTLSYTLTNKAPVPFSWTVKPPPSSLSIHPGDPIPIGIAVGQVPATGVTLLQSSLLEKSRKSLLSPDGLRLCPEPNRACDGMPLTLPANSPMQLWMYGATGVGQYDGSVTVASQEKPEGDSFSLTIYSSRWQYQVAGIGSILFGVVLVWLVGVYGRNRLNRAQLLLPASALRIRLENLLKACEHLVIGEAPNVAKKASDLEKSLSADKLTSDGLVPQKVPAPWNAAAQSESQVERYRQLLQSTSEWLSVLEAITYEGIEKAESKGTDGGLTDVQVKAIEGAIKEIDRIAIGTTAPSLTGVQQGIAELLQKLDGALAPGASARPLRAFVPLQKTPERLSVEITRISAMSWLFLGLASTALGSFVLVLSNPAFGAVSDYVLCFLWGVGIPIGGQQLAQATGATVATTLGITSPR